MFKFLNKKKDTTHISQLSETIGKKIVSAKKKPESQQEIFDNILSFADSVLKCTAEQKQINKQFYSKGNEHPILDVVRLVGRNLQTKYLTSLLSHEDETSLPSLLPGEPFFDSNTYLTIDGKRLSDFKKEVTTTKLINLGKDLVIPWPWKRSRLISTICNIGEDRMWGKWEQDFKNHYIELWLPLGIIWVNGGNHSIASGILQGQGTLKPELTYDISEIFEHIYTDGRNYYRKEDNAVVCPVKDVDFAALFEIGRLMKEHSISF